MIKAILYVPMTLIAGEIWCVLLPYHVPVYYFIVLLVFLMKETIYGIKYDIAKSAVFPTLSYFCPTYWI